MVQDPTKKHKHDPDMEAIFQGVRNLRAQEAPSMKRSEVEASGATNNEQVIYTKIIWYLVPPILIILLNTKCKLRCSVTNTKC